MKFRLTLRFQAALFVAAALSPMSASPLSAKADSPTAFSVQGCPVIPSASAVATKIFGPYEWSAGGAKNFVAGHAMMDLLPAGAYVTECVFVRKWDAGQNAAADDSDILISGYGQLSNSAALLQTWNRVLSKLGLTPTRQGRYHFAERPGLSVGYRDGVNEIAFAYWMVNKQGEYESVAGSRLRPLVTTIISP
jgi:hypothetical protein